MTRRPRAAAVGALFLAALAPSPAAATDAAPATELDALDLADRTAPPSDAPRRDWKAFVEGAAIATRARGDGATTSAQRLSVDVALDTAFAARWRLVMADRIDTGATELSATRTVNTLKDAYVSWQPTPEQALDLGRIKTRLGVAQAYNPTDFLKAGTVRSVVSADPASLRENRMGTGMVRLQTLWTQAALTALVAPKLGSAPSDAPFDPDFGATNPDTRWLLAASRRLAPGVEPQLLLYGGAGRSPQAGLNLSLLADDATVVYVEWAGGRARSNRETALDIDAGRRFRQRSALGLTHTTAQKLSLTLEYHRDGAAPGRDEWRALGRSAGDYVRYRRWAGYEQALATREALFVGLQWQDAGVRHLDLSLFWRRDLVDGSRLAVAQLVHHFARVDLGLQVQQADGDATSVHGAGSARRTVIATLRRYL